MVRAFDGSSQSLPLRLSPSSATFAQTDAQVPCCPLSCRSVGRSAERIAGPERVSVSELGYFSLSGKGRIPAKRGFCGNVCRVVGEQSSVSIRGLLA